MIKVMMTVVVVLSIFFVYQTGNEYYINRYPIFNVGDCVARNADVNGDKEDWERKEVEYVHKILKIGKKKYRTMLFRYGEQLIESDLEFYMNDLLMKVDCPTETRK